MGSGQCEEIEELEGYSQRLRCTRRPTQSLRLHWLGRTATWRCQLNKQSKVTQRSQKVSPLLLTCYLKLMANSTGRREHHCGSNKGQRGHPNQALPVEYDSLPGCREAATSACFAVPYQIRYSNVHVHHAGRSSTDFAGEQRRLRKHVRCVKKNTPIHSCSSASCCCCY